MNTNNELTAIDKNRLVLMDFDADLQKLRNMIHDQEQYQKERNELLDKTAKQILSNYFEQFFNNLASE